MRIADAVTAPCTAAFAAAQDGRLGANGTQNAILLGTVCGEKGHLPYTQGTAVAELLGNSADRADTRALALPAKIAVLARGAEFIAHLIADGKIVGNVGQFFTLPFAAKAIRNGEQGIADQV